MEAVHSILCLYSLTSHLGLKLLCISRYLNNNFILTGLVLCQLLILQQGDRYYTDQSKGVYVCKYKLKNPFEDQSLQKAFSLQHHSETHTHIYIYICFKVLFLSKETSYSTDFCRFEEIVYYLGDESMCFTILLPPEVSYQHF